MNDDLINREALKKELDNIKQTGYDADSNEPLFEYVELPDLIKTIDNAQKVKYPDVKEIIDIIHNTIYQFFDVCGDEKEVPMSDKDKLLLKVNKAICNNLKEKYNELNM